MKEVILSLGSNLGQRWLNVQHAIAYLQSVSSLRVTQSSSVYESAPMYVTNQPWYLNMVVAVQTQLSAYEMLSTCKSIEERLGRVGGRRYGPRTIDLDILTCGDEVLDTPLLTIPHKRLTERLFVLLPLQEIYPTWSHPITQQTIDELLQACTVTSSCCPKRCLW